MRLDKFLSECTIHSRTDIKKLIKMGKVTLNGQIISKGDIKVDKESDVVSVNGKDVQYRKFVYLMLNKPQGVVSATWDKHAPYVTQLVPEEFKHYDVFPAGRLDIDTEGLLILTNDGDFNHKLTSPKKNVYKKYFAVLDAPVDQADVEVFKEGIEFSDFTSKPAVLEIGENPKEVLISIAEGKFHQVKRMCAYVGKNVVFLKRVSIGRLTLDESLAPGECRAVSEAEMKLLFENPAILAKNLTNTKNYDKI